MEEISRKRKLANMIIIEESMNDNREEYLILTKFATYKWKQNYVRLTRERFYFVLSLVEEDLTTPSYNRIKEPITAVEKLALTLRLLATGESYRSLSFGYRIPYSAISTIVPKVLAALQKKLVPLFLPPPELIHWEQKADKFWKHWCFPNCIASIDGKDMGIVSPAKSRSLYFNYKGYFSVVLLAMIDANCKFVFIHVGSYGKYGDAGIFKKSKMGEFVENGTMFPPPKYLPNSDTLLPHVVVGDDAFNLSEHMVKPYPRVPLLQDERKGTFNLWKQSQENV
nr:uncharacterized protein LOC111514994 [Leptinotarsa decemlineata]